jgi:hypothetical protein
MASAQQFKSVFDSFMDREVQYANQQVSFADAIQRARIAQSQENRAIIQSNQLSQARQIALRGQQRNDAYSDFVFKNYAPQLAALKNKVAITSGEGQLMGLEVRNAMARGDVNRLSELRGTKVEIQNGRFMESRDNGATWYDMNTGTTQNIIGLKEQADTAALAAGIRQANLTGYPVAQQQAAGVAAGMTPADTSSGDAIRFGRAARPGTDPTSPSTPSSPQGAALQVVLPTSAEPPQFIIAEDGGYRQNPEWLKWKSMLPDPNYSFNAEIGAFGN